MATSNSPHPSERTAPRAAAGRDGGGAPVFTRTGVRGSTPRPPPARTPPTATATPGPTPRRAGSTSRLGQRAEDVDVRVGRRRIHHRPGQHQAQRAGVPLLVPGEVGGEQRRAVSLDPAQAGQMATGRCRRAGPERPPPPPGAGAGSPHAAPGSSTPRPRQQPAMAGHGNTDRRGGARPRSGTPVRRPPRTPAIRRRPRGAARTSATYCWLANALT